MNKLLEFLKKSGTTKKFVVLGGLFTAVAVGIVSYNDIPAYYDTLMGLFL